MMKRLFVAFRVEPSDSLLEAYEKFRKWFGKENITWTEPHNFHVTLKFIGDTPEDKIRDITAALKRVAARYSGFTAEIKGIGVFGSSYKPKVIWCGIEDPSLTLAPLTRDVVGVLEELGFADDRQNYVPHLTLGRIKFIRFKKKLEEKVSKFKDVDFHRFTVSDFYLFESQLTPDGPVYQVIQRYPLSAQGRMKDKHQSPSFWGRLWQRFRP